MYFLKDFTEMDLTKILFCIFMLYLDIWFIVFFMVFLFGLGTKMIVDSGGAAQ
jgi:hypothetical protein